MSTPLEIPPRSWLRWRRFRREQAEQISSSPARGPSGDQAKDLVASSAIEQTPIEIAPSDPLFAYFLSAPGAVELEKLLLDSPALRALREAGVKVAVPLVSQNELIGVLNLGARMSEQDYSADDRGLLNTLASQAAPAVRVAQLVREQRERARERERIEQELRVARLIQQTLLPRNLPVLPGWNITPYYQPARAVGGDFYDFIPFPDGRLGVVIGDVTDKGVPAALVMATTRSILRTAAQGEGSPGKTLERANDLLFPDIPEKMFVTCFYAILDPANGHLRYANAGHDLPYQRRLAGVTELRATGMPLGAMPGSRYEEKETTLARGEHVLLYSDGLVEAHSPAYDMFGFPRLEALMGQHADGGTLIEFLLAQLGDFTGDGWEQEDDVTLVALQHLAAPGPGGNGHSPSPEKQASEPDGGGYMRGGEWRLLNEWSFPSAPGNERLAIAAVNEALGDHLLSQRRREQLASAVAEATMNAMEHGNHYQLELPVMVEALVSDTAVAVRISDEGGAGVAVETPDDYEPPDLAAKLAGLQTPRGWGLFLIKHLVDEMRVSADEKRHTVELIMRLEEPEEKEASDHAITHA
jgi:serine phosphatase RsbU (regulator of sigma subunit)/anti-sigma regulatory factor (Ser/Thr protein kinase)